MGAAPGELGQRGAGRVDDLGAHAVGGDGGDGEAVLGADGGTPSRVLTAFTGGLETASGGVGPLWRVPGGSGAGRQGQRVRAGAGGAGRW
ncbi:hypothetical protein GCM10009834_28550 [Streptomonospora arabica]